MPRVRCTDCRELVDEEEVVWALPDGQLSVDHGDPYCVGCCPEQPEYDKPRA